MAALRRGELPGGVAVVAHRMAAGTTRTGQLLFTGNTERTAMKVAFALAEEFAPDHPYFPIHVTRYRGGHVDTYDNGLTIRLAVRITAAPHPGESRPGNRGTGTERSQG
jgi:hypothetical protein